MCVAGTVVHVLQRGKKNKGQIADDFILTILLVCLLLWLTFGGETK